MLKNGSVLVYMRILDILLGLFNTRTQRETLISVVEIFWTDDKTLVKYHIIS